MPRRRYLRASPLATFGPRRSKWGGHCERNSTRTRASVENRALAPRPGPASGSSALRAWLRPMPIMPCFPCAPAPERQPGCPSDTCASYEERRRSACKMD